MSLLDDNSFKFKPSHWQDNISRLQDLPSPFYDHKLRHPHLTRAFENNKEESEPRHITTINESYAGQTYPGTDVRYVKRTFQCGGERLEGVFPQFNSLFDTHLSHDLWQASDALQFRYCTEKLAERIRSDPDFAAKFTPRQREQILNHEPRISGLTWHHSEIGGQIQLVDATEHSTCRHTGGRSLWGGSSANR